jgi:Zn-dependent M28 family amino/carboxypeptidase
MRHLHCSVSSCFFPLLFFIAVLTAPAGAQRISYHPVEQGTVEQRLKTAPAKNPEREPELHQLFEGAGCAGEALTEATVKGANSPNLICTLRGESDSIIVVGAHFDKVAAGEGVVDNWSGASLLPSLFESLKGEPRRHTFVFIGFTDEEKGLVGSEAYAKRLTREERSKIRAMVNMDSLGLSPTKVWLSHADKKLAEALNLVAHTMKLPLTWVNVEGVGASTDSEPFASRKIPSLTIHSVTQETFPVLHSAKDQLSAIHLDDYYATYKLVAVYLAYLDQTLPTGKEEAPAAQK